MRTQHSVRRADATDALIATAFYALSLALMVGLIDSPGRRAVAAVVTLLHVGPLAVRRRWPVAVLVAMSAAAVASVAADLPVVILGPGVVVAVYTLGTREGRSLAQPVLAGVVLVMTGVVLLNNGDGSTVASNAAVLVLAWWLGDRSRVTASNAEAERLAAAEAVRRAALDERMRIARELHDVVAHSMSVIAVQAGAARFAAEAGDNDVDALGAIERTSRSALEEMRRLLTVLRDDDAVGDLAPTPRLDQIEDLVAATRRAGVAVAVRCSGEPAPLPAGVELCVYRIVQESLTNVRKHARARNATVEVSYEPSVISVEVHDDGVGAGSGERLGHGLVGMRERATLYGGTFSAGPSPEGGYCVRATFPIGATS